jgi:hypothetical protein
MGYLYLLLWWIKSEFIYKNWVHNNFLSCIFSINETKRHKYYVQVYKMFKVTKEFSCFKMLGTQAHLFPEPEHTFKRASNMMPRQSSQTVHRGWHFWMLLTVVAIRNLHHHQQHTCSDNYQLMVVILTKWGGGGIVKYGPRLLGSLMLSHFAWQHHSRSVNRR